MVHDGRREPARPLVWAASGLLAGQCAGPAFFLPLTVIFAAVALPAFLFRRGSRHGALLAVAFAAALVGAAETAGLHDPDLGPDHVRRLVGSTADLRGRIAARPSRGGSGTRLAVEIETVRRGETWEAIRGRVLVTVRSPSFSWKRGDRVEARLRLREPRNFGNPGEFDYVAYLARRGIHVTAFAPDDRLWKRTADGERGLSGRLERWRDDAARFIQETLAEPEASILGALLLGESAAVGAEVRERYARAGVSHVLAISGLHIGLVVGSAYAAAYWLLARSEWILLRTTVPKLALVLTLPPVFLYTVLAGGGVATLRASFMTGLVVVAVLLDRRRDWLSALAFAAMVVSFLLPGAVFEVSFQLSFAAVLAIILGAGRIRAMWDAWEERRLLRLRRGPWRLLRGLVLYQAVTLSALLGTAPLVAWHFNRASIVGLIANSVVVPVIGIVPVSAGLLAVLLSPFAPWLAEALLRLAGSVVSVADVLVRFFAAVPGGSPRVVTPSSFELALLYALLGSFLLRPRRLRRLFVASCLILLAADAAWWYAQRFHGSALTVTFISVGQGDSTLIEFPGGEVMIVDGGGLSPTFDTGERIVAPQLWRRKIARIDTLVLTHADFDHFGGLGFLAREFAPRDFWWNGSPGHGERFAAFRASLRNTRAFAAERGRRRSIGGVEVAILHPDPAVHGSDNDRSLTLRLAYGPTAVLLPGDLEAGGELALVTAARHELASTVLKVPHHGSRTSSTPLFLAAVAPTLAVVSCGYDNRFGFPHPRVLEAYSSRNIEVLRTDRDGAISVRIEPEGGITVTRGSSLDRIARPRLKRDVFSSPSLTGG